MKRFFFTVIAVLLLLLCLTGCSEINISNELNTSETVDISTVVPYEQELILTAEYPHSTDSFTQGLFFYKGQLYESVGKYGQSKLHKNIGIRTGESEIVHNFSEDIFAEGSVVYNEKLYVLTWKENEVFIFNPDTLMLEKTVDYTRQGWGLTTDGYHLIASDGTDSIYYMDEHLETVKTLSVTRDGEPVSKINELEYINGKIWANIWMTDEIIVVDPQTGCVEIVIGFSGLHSSGSSDKNDVFNGIAYNPGTEKLYVTGKRWDTLYEFEFKN